jgi:hypothetical protein
MLRWEVTVPFSNSSFDRSYRHRAGEDLIEARCWRAVVRGGVERQRTPRARAAAPNEEAWCSF